MATETKTVDVQEELLKTTKQKPRKDGESTGKFLTRLAKAAGTLEDEDFEKLSEETQHWINAAAEKVNSGEEPAGFPITPGADAEKVEDEKDTDEEESEDEKPKKGTKTEKPKKGTKTEKPAMGNGKKAQEPKEKRGVCHRLREIWVGDPDTTVEKAVATVEKQGYTVATSTAVMVKREVEMVLAVIADRKKNK